MMVEGVLSTTMITADKVLIAAMLSRRVLGIYSLANAGIGILITIPSSLGQMLFVKFAEMDGQRKNNQYISDALDKISFIMSGFSAFLVALAVGCFPVIVVLLLPQFVDGIKPGRLLIAYVFFQSISSPIGNWFVSTGRVVPILTIRTVAVVAEVTAIYLVIRSGGQLEDIAMCVLITSASFGFSIHVLSKYFLNQSIRRGLWGGAKTILPFASVLATIRVQDHLYPGYIPGTEMSLLLACIVSLLVGLTINIPVLYLVDKRTPVRGLIYQVLLPGRHKQRGAHI